MQSSKKPNTQPKKKKKLSAQSSLHAESSHSQQQKESKAKLNSKSSEVSTQQDKAVSQATEEKSGNNSDDSLGDNSEDEDGIDWETIELPPRFEDMPEPQEGKVYNDVEVIIQTSSQPVINTKKKSYWEQAYQRNVRDWTHNAHIVLLVAHYRLRNKWCSFSDIKNACLSIIPQDTRRLLEKDTKEKTLITGIKWLMNWWDGYFTITGPGLISTLSTEYEDWMGKDFSDLLKEEEDQKVEGLDAFLNVLLEEKKGTRDTCAQLFVALLRACGCEARLVCSLQPVSYKIPASRSKQPQQGSSSTDHHQEEEEEEEEKTPLLFPFKPTMRPTAVDPNKQLKSSKAKPPIIWAEVYASDTERWICVDPIRKHLNKPLLMEPAQLNKENHLSLVLAMDETGASTDVTRRYTHNMERALRLRERPLTVREKQAGLTLWSDLFLNILCHLRHNKKNRERIEKREQEHHELEQKGRANERMPTAFEGFKKHPIYALERHLKRLEVIYPALPVLGSFKGDKIYPRSSVKSVSTADAWKKVGRVVKAREVPIKHIPSRAFTIEKRRLKEQAKQEGKELMVACYGEWQTVPYQSEPVVDGKVPKNSFGNIDLFTAEMLPKGAAHIPIKGIGKMAKQLDIDYADAVVDFEFVKMRSVPVLDGIVVAEEYKDTLIKVWNEYEQERINKAIEKQEKQVYLRWRKLIKGLLIKARIDSEYQKEDPMDWSAAGGGGGGGGFLPEE
ncbi:Rad4-domain-containing protein [Backusella circina FSU 941]|nr:Rad4-domain-containing protein [Backusella circina FSU 941]